MFKSSLFLGRGKSPLILFTFCLFPCNSISFCGIKLILSTSGSAMFFSLLIKWAFIGKNINISFCFSLFLGRKTHWPSGCLNDGDNPSECIYWFAQGLTLVTFQFQCQKLKINFFIQQWLSCTFNGIYLMILINLYNPI